MTVPESELLEAKLKELDKLGQEVEDAWQANKAGKNNIILSATLKRAVRIMLQYNEALVKL